MKDNTSNQNEKCIEMFLEALSQVPNIFKGIREQDELPMTRKESFLKVNFIIIGIMDMYSWELIWMVSVLEWA